MALPRPPHVRGSAHRGVWGDCPHGDKVGDMLIIHQLVEFSCKLLCPRHKPKMKTPTRQILHCTAGVRAGRLLAATLSLAIWTNAAAANQAANVPAPSPNKLERITEGGKVSYEVLISTKGKREEIKFASDGKVLERENKTGSKDND